MPREIKFRAWDKDRSIMLVNHTFESIGETGLYRWENIDWMQYTGLKDKNGVPVYEGDIIETDDGVGSVQYADDMGVYECQYKNGSRALYGFIKRDRYLNPEFSFTPRVIGNIYEHGDLLDVQAS